MFTMTAMTMPAVRPGRAMARWVLAALMLLAAVMASPPAFARDDGQWEILNARYGTSQRNMDVTDQLRELARRDDRVRVSNEFFGNDPAYGRIKVLRIYARKRDGATRVFEFPEGSVIDGNQFTGWGRGDWGQGGWNGGWEGRPGRPNDGYGQGQDNRLNIVRATYGSGGRFVDVTDRLRNISRGGVLDVRVDNDLAGRDPAYGETKTLRVYFTRGRGREQMAEAQEGSRMRLP